MLSLYLDYSLQTWEKKGRSQRVPGLTLTRVVWLSKRHHFMVRRETNETTSRDMLLQNAQNHVVEQIFQHKENLTGRGTREISRSSVKAQLPACKMPETRTYK
eukprot:93551-Amphidinium_carterae.1